MPKKDNFHETVKTALETEGWRVTNDPLFVPTKGGTNFFIDLGAERILCAEKEGSNIAIEIKSFNSNSPMYSFYEILGQFLVYKIALSEQKKPWDLFIAMPDIGFKKLDESLVFNQAMQQYGMQFILVSPISKSIVEWKK